MRYGWRRILPNEAEGGGKMFLNIVFWTAFFHKKKPVRK